MYMKFLGNTRNPELVVVEWWWSGSGGGGGGGGRYLFEMFVRLCDTFENNLRDTRC